MAVILNGLKSDLESATSQRVVLEERAIVDIATTAARLLKLSPGGTER